MDIKFTTKTGRARLKVAVINPDRIPDLVDVVIGDTIYELQFCVEQESLNSPPSVIEMDPNLDEDKENEENGEGNMDEDSHTADGAAAHPSAAPLAANMGGADIPKGSSSLGVDLHAVAQGSKPVAILTPSGVLPDGKTQWKAQVTTEQVKLLEKNIQVTGASPMRARKRNSATVDQDSLEKATKLKACKNLDAPAPKVMFHNTHRLFLCLMILLPRELLA